MRVGIDLSCWSNRRGYGRFTRGLVPALMDRGGHEYVLFLDAPSAAREELPTGVERVVVATREAAAEAASASHSRSVKDLLAMAAAVARTPLDVLFYPSVYTYFPAPGGATVILGVHDVIAEDHPEMVFPELRRRLLWYLKGRLAHQRADWILAVSEHARRGILRHFRHPPERVWVVEEAPDPVFRPLAAGELNHGVLSRVGVGSAEPYLLYVGGVNPHKNLPALLRALAALRRRRPEADLRLVLVGDVERDPFTPGIAEVRQEIAAHHLEEAVCFAGYLADGELVHLMNGARALVLPSLAEGFGLPAVEAAACGTPVAATRNSPLPQLLAGCGYFFDPRSPSEMIRALAALLDDEPERRRRASGALDRARRLSWERSARSMAELLQTVERSRR